MADDGDGHGWHSWLLPGLLVATSIIVRVVPELLCADWAHALRRSADGARVQGVGFLVSKFWSDDSCERCPTALRRKKKAKGACGPQWAPL